MEDDLYDWFLYDTALAALGSQEEREALCTAAWSFQRGVRAGVLPVRWELGVFGLESPHRMTLQGVAAGGGADGGGDGKGERKRLPVTLLSGF